MKEQDLLNNYYIKKGSRTILEPQGTFINNIYCSSIVEGLAPEGNAWEQKDGETHFIKDGLKEDFFKVLDMFFANSWISSEPDMEGTINDNLTNLSLTTSSIVIEAKDMVPLERTFLIASDTVYPLQFIINGENLRLDTDTSFEVKDIVWFCLRPGGFIISMDAEQFGVFVSLFEDVLKRQETKTFQEKVNFLYRPTTQEKIFKAFASFYLYLKETDALDTSYIRL